MTLDGTGTAVGQLLIFLTTLISTVVTLYIQHRNRKWDLERQARDRQWDMEDRARIAAELKAKADEATERAAAEVKLETRKQHSVLVKKVDENTKISVDAFREANDVNQKIARIGTLINAVQPGGKRSTDAVAGALLELGAERKAAQQDSIQETVEDNNRLLRQSKGDTLGDTPDAS